MPCKKKKRPKEIKDGPKYWKYDRGSSKKRAKPIKEQK